MRRHHLVAAIILALPFALAACNPYTTITGAPQSCNIGFKSNVSGMLHPGDQFSVSWKLDGSNNSQTNVKMTAILYGPYDSVDAAKADGVKAGSGGTPTAPALAAPTLTAMCDGQNYSTTLQLPTSQKPGIYDLVQKGELQGVSNGTTASGDSIITIAPPASS